MTGQVIAAGNARSSVDDDYRRWRRELDEIVTEPDPAVANRRITSAHDDLSDALARVLGPDAGANFHTWAVWGSLAAGTTIGEGDVPGLRWRVAAAGGVVGALVGFVAGGSRGAVVGFVLAVLAAVVVTTRELRQARDHISHGNRIVLDEIGGATARFVATFAEGPRDDAALAEFLSHLRHGSTVLGGQDLLRHAFAFYHAAIAERDPSRRHQLVFAANCQAVWHEHLRLQPDIAGAIPRPLRHVITASLLHYRVGHEALHVGRDLTQVPAWPPTLTTLDEPVAVAVVDALRDHHRAPGSLTGSGARDWTDLAQRMNYVVDLFRSRHLASQVFDDYDRERENTRARLSGL